MTKGKYEVNAEFLAWAEENFHILKNAKMFGGNPANGVKLGGIGQSTEFNTYGFSAWDGEDGIISMRNPDSKAQTITFTLDRNIGLAESTKDKTLYSTGIHSYKMCIRDRENNLKPEIYDVVLYKRDNGKYILHRIIDVDSNGYVMCGDNQFIKELVRKKKQILAVMTGFYRDKKY